MNCSYFIALYQNIKIIFYKHIYGERYEYKEPSSLKHPRDFFDSFYKATFLSIGGDQNRLACSCQSHEE